VVSGREGSVSYASPAAGALFGTDEAALTGRPVETLIHEDDRQELRLRMRDDHDSDKAPGATAWQCRTVHVDGSQKWVEITFTDLLNDPAVGGVVLRLRDITERRRLETELRHAQKMESVGQLAAGVAHEINTPIQFIGDNLRFLTESVTDMCALIRAYQAASGPPEPTGDGAGDGRLGDPSSAHRLAAEIDIEFLMEELPTALAQTRDGVDRVATIVRAMKASAHPGTEGKVHADLNEAVRSTLILANGQIKYVADVDLQLGDLPPVCCHLGDINQVVLNLVLNAAQAIDESMQAGGPRGRITVTTRHVGEDVLVEVQDTGAGIAPEIAERVFEQFFTTKDVGVGTGQGLSLAYALVHDRHHGSLSFSSEVGVGTTFAVRLPIDQPRRD
jgi:PAS domain S-box-containing protein